MIGSNRMERWVPLPLLLPPLLMLFLAGGRAATGRLPVRGLESSAASALIHGTPIDVRYARALSASPLIGRGTR